MTYSITFVLRLIGRNTDHSINAATGFALIIAIIIATSGIIEGFSETIFGLTEQAGYSNRFAIKKNSENKLSREIFDSLQQSDIGDVLRLAKRKTTFSTGEKSLETDLVGTNLSILGAIFTTMDLFEGTFPNKSYSPMECVQGLEVRGFLIAGELVQIDSLDNSLNITGTISGLAELQQTILIDLEHYATLIGESVEALEYDEIKVHLEESLTIEEMKKMLVRALDYPSVQALNRDLLVWNEQQADVFANKLRDDIYSKLQILFAVLFIIALTRLFQSISWFADKYERSLLIMRAMGMSRGRIFIMIILLGQVVGNIGFVLGLIIGYISPPLILSIMASTLNITFLVTEFPIEFILPMWLVSIIIIVAASIIPSMRISSTPPAKISMIIMDR